jgi:hypothetical protein
LHGSVTLLGSVEEEVVVFAVVADVSHLLVG